MSATCTINNNDQPATLDAGQDGDQRQRRHGCADRWTLTATGPTTISGVTGSAAVTSAPVNAGTYALSESAVRPATRRARGPARPARSPGSSLVLPIGVSATCTINNNDQPPT